MTRLVKANPKDESTLPLEKEHTVCTRSGFGYFRMFLDLNFIRKRHTNKTTKKLLQKLIFNWKLLSWKMRTRSNY